MDHDVRIRQREPFAFCARAEQDRRHACCHPKAVSCHVAGQELHRVVNREPRRHHAAAGIDVDADVFLGIFHLQKEQLRDHQVRNVVVDRRPDKNDPVFQQT